MQEKMFITRCSVLFQLVLWREFMRTENGVDITVTAKVAICQSMMRIVEFVADDAWNVNECISTEKEVKKHFFEVQTCDS